MANTLTVDAANADAGALPPCKRPGIFMHGFAVDPQFLAMTALPNIGLLRVHIDPYLGFDKYDFLSRIQTAFDTDDPYFVAPLRAGVPMLIDLRTQGRWFRRAASTINGEQEIENTYPADLDLLEQVAFELADKFITNGIDPTLVHVSVTNEPSNPTAEASTIPNSRNTEFCGSIEELVVYCAHWFHGWKRRDRRFRTGGCQFGGQAGSTLAMRDPSDLEWAVEKFIRLCATPPHYVYGGARVPLDFVSYHMFHDFTLDYNHGSIPVWLRKYGYDPDYVSIFMDESSWRLSDADTGDNTPSRNGAIQAAMTAARAHQCELEGVDRWCHALITAGQINDTATGYEGNTGIFYEVQGGAHDGEFVPTATKHAMWMLSQLGKRKITHELSSDAFDVGFTVTTTAEAGSSTRWLLICRYALRGTVGYPLASDITGRFVQLMRERGYRSLRSAVGLSPSNVAMALAFDTGLSQTDQTNYVNGILSPRAGLPAPVLADLAEVKASCLAFKAAWNGPVDFIYTVADPGVVTAITEYKIDLGVTNNPYAAFVAQQAIGSYDSAVEAALAEGGNMTATFTGDASDLPRTVPADPFFLMLVKIEGNGTPNPNSAGWVAKPVNEDIGLFLDPAVEVDTDPTVAGRLKGIPRTYNRRQHFGEQALTFGASVPWDLDTHQNASLAVAGACTVQTPSHMAAGIQCVLRVIQGGAGGIVPSFSAAYRRIPTKWSQVPGTFTLLSFYCTGAEMICVGSVIV